MDGKTVHFVFETGLLLCLRMAQNVLVYGPQGSGKTTQAILLSHALHVPAVSMGQLLREEAKNPSERGKRIAPFVDRGEFVGDHEATEILRERGEKGDMADGYVLDGYPRHLSQISLFPLSNPTQVLVIDVPEEESVRRISSRLICGKCQRLYIESPAVQSGSVCPCGGILERRADDQPEVVRKRLQLYEKETTPVIAHYEKKGIVSYVNGMGNMEDVQKRIYALFFLK